MSTTTIRERPVIFSGPMINAILEDRKTQTRRVVTRWAFEGDESGCGWEPGPCPYGVPGDRLWIRESAYIAPPNFGEPGDGNATDPDGRRRVVGYAATMNGEAVRCAKDYGVSFTPPIHMPRWASRIALEITEVRVERLQAITAEDIVAEGFHPLGPEHDPRILRQEFSALWDKLNAARGFPWDSNPWVWVIGFRRIECTTN